MLKEFFLGKTRPACPEHTVDILRLIKSENVGPKTFLHLVKVFGSAKTALENIGELSLKGGRTKPIKIFSKSSAERELELLDKNNAKIITYQSLDYSRLLLEIPDFPPVLSYKGNIELLNTRKSIGVVGARNASLNGRTFTTRIVKELVEHNYIIVSGLARGIDTAAHQDNTDKTIAVIAGGIDHIYPPENSKLYAQIAEHGLIVAELAIGTAPMGIHFPQRNRIISGLSLGTLVIEASLKSGSLITAHMALDQNREVFAVPGFPLDPRSQGTNKLIKDGAILVESINDIINNLPEFTNKESTEDNFADNNLVFGAATNCLTQITDDMRKAVINLLSASPIYFEDLLQETNLSAPIIHTIILELELAGNVARSPGNKISLVYK